MDQPSDKSTPTKSHMSLVQFQPGKIPQYCVFHYGCPASSSWGSTVSASPLVEKEVLLQYLYWEINTEMQWFTDMDGFALW
jgi:hypothetical protein